jgi:uncharacterized protein YciI
MATTAIARSAVAWLLEHAKRRGPDAAKWIWENKEEAIRIATAVISAYKWTASKFDSVSATMAALERHLDYLAASADNERESRVASGWRRELEAIRQAFDLSRHAPTVAQRREERKQLKARLERMRVMVSGAVIDERMEDAGGPESRWAAEASSESSQAAGASGSAPDGTALGSAG